MNREELKGHGGRGFLHASHLKIFACVTMFIDHIGAVLLMKMRVNSIRMDILYWICRWIGRLALPIFCYLLIEGFIYSKNRKKYIQRVALFTLLSEPAFDLAFYGKVWDFRGQNVLWAFFVSLVMLVWIEKYTENKMIGAVIMMGASYLTFITRADYGFFIPVFVYALYQLRYYKRYQILVGAIMVSWELVAPLSFILLKFYDGKRGRQIKYIFYAFYPVHMLFLYGIQRIMEKGVF